MGNTDEIEVEVFTIEEYNKSAKLVDKGKQIKKKHVMCP